MATLNKNYRQLGGLIIDFIADWHRKNGLDLASEEAYEQLNLMFKGLMETQPSREQIRKAAAALGIELKN